MQYGSLRMLLYAVRGSAASGTPNTCDTAATGPLLATVVDARLVA
jgi:hypothetical protein